MTILIRSHFMPSEFNNYLIAGNVCNAFSLGKIGSTDDFFLVGAEPADESNYPLLTGNILDSEGNFLFRLVRNVLAVNPGHCSRIFGDHIGYEIHDGSGNLIFKVRTTFEHLPGSNQEMFITTISANFYNKNRELVFRANSGEEDEYIEVNTPCAFGFAGGFGLVQGMSQDERNFLHIALASRGAIHQPLTGTLEGQDIDLDGKAITNALLRNCTIHVKTGEFVLLESTFDSCRFMFHDAAENIRKIVVAIAQSQQNPPNP